MPPVATRDKTTRALFSLRMRREDRVQKGGWRRRTASPTANKKLGALQTHEELDDVARNLQEHANLICELWMGWRRNVLDESGWSVGYLYSHVFIRFVKWSHHFLVCIFSWGQNEEIRKKFCFLKVLEKGKIWRILVGFKASRELWNIYSNFKANYESGQKQEAVDCETSQFLIQDGWF